MRGYAQKDPKQEYKREAFELFDSLLSAVRREVTRILMTVRIASPEEVAAAEAAAQPEALDNVRYEHEGDNELADGTAENPYAGTGRNEPCPCGSGKKFKHCHGSLG